MSTALTVAALPFAAMFIANNILPYFFSKKNVGNDKTMLSFRKKKQISSYTKFQIVLKPGVNMDEALSTLNNTVSTMLEEDSLVNIIPDDKTYTRRSLSDIVHPFKFEPKSPKIEPNFDTISFSVVNTACPVHVYTNPKCHSIFFFIDHCIADGLTMYNEVVAPIISNPKFKLAKRPIYVPFLTEFHQIYVIGRMAYLFARAQVSSYMGNIESLVRLPKSQQYAAFHELPLSQIKDMKNEWKVPVAAVIMAVLIKHLGKSLKKGKDRFKICLSYAFENKNSFNNYSFIIVDVGSDMSMKDMSQYIHKQLFNRRHEINTMYHLLQLPSGAGKVQSVVQQTLCDAYIAMTMVPEGSKEEGEQNQMGWMKNEHFSISTGINMTAVSVGTAVHVSSKVGLKDIDENVFRNEMHMENVK